MKRLKFKKAMVLSKAAIRWMQYSLVSTVKINALIVSK